MFTPPSLASTEWSSGGLPGTRAAATYRVLLFLAAGGARARAPASWSWRWRETGGVPVIVCIRFIVGFSMVCAKYVMNFVQFIGKVFEM